MATQTNAEKMSIFKYWFEFVKPREFPTLADVHSNGQKIGDYIDREFSGVFSIGNISIAVEKLKTHLHGLGVATPEQIAKLQAKTAEQKEAERVQQIEAQKVATVELWLKNHAPTGLLVDGKLTGTDADKIWQFIKSRCNDEVTIENLNTAVAILTESNALTYFSRDPEAMKIRGIKPKVRVMTEQAMVDAGLKIPLTERNHSRDTKIVNPIEKLRPITKTVLGDMESPDKTRAEQISVTTRSGKLDHGFTANLRKTFAHNPDKSINWKETLRLRTAAADEYEKRRNRDGGQRG
jgi:hypothetical protein